MKERAMRGMHYIYNYVAPINAFLKLLKLKESFVILFWCFPPEKGGARWGGRRREGRRFNGFRTFICLSLPKNMVLTHILSLCVIQSKFHMLP